MKPRWFIMAGSLFLILAIATFLPVALASHKPPPPPPPTGGVIATIVLPGSEPNQIAFDPSNNKVYVSHQGNCYGCIGSVSVIDASTNRIATEVSLGSNPGALLYNPSNAQIYVIVQGGVAVIDPNTNKVLTTIAINNAAALAYDPANHDVYVSGWQTIWIVDSSSDKVVGQINGVAGSNLTVDSNKTYLYASDDYANTLFVIDTLTNKMIANILMCQSCNPGVMAFNPTNGRIYLSNFGAGTVSVISDTNNQILTTIAVGNNPWGALFDPSNQKVYIAEYTSAALSKIDPATNIVVATLSSGNGPWNIALDTASGLLYVTNLGSDTVTVLTP